MFLVGILSWWYGRGWHDRFVTIRNRLVSVADYFSVGILLSTIFAPYRQISAGRAQGSLAIRASAAFDQLVSRAIGALMRVSLILIAIVMTVFHMLWGGVVIVMWPIVPLFPVIGIVLWIFGWVPTWA